MNTLSGGDDGELTQFLAHCLRGESAREPGGTVAFLICGPRSGKSVFSHFLANHVFGPEQAVLLSNGTSRISHPHSLENTQLAIIDESSDFDSLRADVIPSLPSHTGVLVLSNTAPPPQSVNRDILGRPAVIVGASRHRDGAADIPTPAASEMHRMMMDEGAVVGEAFRQFLMDL